MASVGENQMHQFGNSTTESILINQSSASESHQQQQVQYYLNQQREFEQFQLEYTFLKEQA